MFGAVILQPKSERRVRFFIKEPTQTKTENKPEQGKGTTIAYCQIALNGCYRKCPRVKRTQPSLVLEVSFGSIRQFSEFILEDRIIHPIMPTSAKKK